MKKNIQSLEELEEEQKKLRLLIYVTKQEFTRSISSNRKEFKNSLLQKIAIPAGVLSLGAKVFNQASNVNSASSMNQSTVESTNTSRQLIAKLLPIGLNIAQSYFLKKQNQTTKSQEEIAALS